MSITTVMLWNLNIIPVQVCYVVEGNDYSCEQLMAELCPHSVVEISLNDSAISILLHFQIQFSNMPLFESTSFS